MKELRINGHPRTLPIDENLVLQELLDYIQNHWSESDQVLGSLKLDGQELLPDVPAEFSRAPLSTFESLEIEYKHPREVAEETLQMMMEYSGRLAELAEECAENLDTEKGDHSLQTLVDGVGTLVESIFEVRKILRIGIFPGMNLLESELTSILRDLEQTLLSRNLSYRFEILSQSLPANLRAWQQDVLPRMVRSRDT
jgi:hypothetical protein